MDGLKNLMSVAIGSHAGPLVSPKVCVIVFFLYAVRQWDERKLSLSSEMALGQNLGSTSECIAASKKFRKNFQ
jgi:hypothetical protein